MTFSNSASDKHPPEDEEDFEDFEPYDDDDMGDD